MFNARRHFARCRTSAHAGPDPLLPGPGHLVRGRCRQRRHPTRLTRPSPCVNSGGRRRRVNGSCSGWGPNSRTSKSVRSRTKPRRRPPRRRQATQPPCNPPSNATTSASTQCRRRAARPPSSAAAATSSRIQVVAVCRPTPRPPASRLHPQPPAGATGTRRRQATRAPSGTQPSARQKEIARRQAEDSSAPPDKSARQAQDSSTSARPKARRTARRAKSTVARRKATHRPALSRLTSARALLDRCGASHFEASTASRA